MCLHIIFFHIISLKVLFMIFYITLMYKNMHKQGLDNVLFGYKLAYSSLYNTVFLVLLLTCMLGFYLYDYK